MFLLSDGRFRSDDDVTHVEVPILFTSVPGAAPPPTAPICASYAPTQTITDSESPSFCAHSGVSVPAGTSVVQVSVPSESRMSESFGSSLSKNLRGGYPPHSARHMIL